MDENKAKLKKELMRYGKEEIVDAMLEQFNSVYIANDCLRTLRPKRTQACLMRNRKRLKKRMRRLMNTAHGWTA